MGWVEQACAELGIPALDLETVTLTLDMTGVIAHEVARPAAPLTALIVGLAAASDPHGKDIGASIRAVESLALRGKNNV
jgi:hypothetical protein